MNLDFVREEASIKLRECLTLEKRMNRVLLVEDSGECQLVVSRALANTNIEVFTTNSQSETLELKKKRGANFDLVILDLMLPDSDGFTILEDLKSAGMPAPTPVFFLTSQSELSTKITAFNLGADDYLVKPVSPIELRARVEMRLRKASTVIADTIRKGELVIEMMVLRASRLINKKQVDLSLTAKEFKILASLVQNENKVFSRSQIVEAVWGPDVHILDRTVDSHIYGLRKKMGPLAHYIECIPNAGYRFIQPDSQL